MNRAGVLEEVRQMRFEEVYNQYRSRRLSCSDAADLLGTSVSSFYRYRRRYEDEGASGLADRRLGKMSHRRARVDEVMKVLNLFETRYYDFTVKHFQEKLAGHGVHRAAGTGRHLLKDHGDVHARQAVAPDACRFARL